MHEDQSSTSSVFSMSKRGEKDGSNSGHTPRPPMWGCGRCGADSTFCWRATCRSCGTHSPQKYRRLAAAAARSPSASATRGKSNVNVKVSYVEAVVSGGNSAKELIELKAELARLS